MKQINTIYTLEMNYEELELITTALHGEYKHVKELRNDNQDIEQGPRLYNKMESLRNLRNAFANLIDRRYMGEDA